MCRHVRGDSRARRHATRKRPAFVGDFIACRGDDALGYAFSASRAPGGIWLLAAAAAFVADLGCSLRACVKPAACTESVFFDLAAVPDKLVSIATLGLLLHAAEPVGVLVGATEVLGFLDSGVDVRNAVVTLGL